MKSMRRLQSVGRDLYTQLSGSRYVANTEKAAVARSGGDERMDRSSSSGIYRNKRECNTA